MRLHAVPEPSGAPLMLLVPLVSFGRWWTSATVGLPSSVPVAASIVSRRR